MRRLLLCFAVAAGCFAMSVPPEASAGGPILPNCIPYCCPSSVPGTQQCWYNNEIKTCSWFRRPGYSACL